MNPIHPSWLIVAVLTVIALVALIGWIVVPTAPRDLLYVILACIAGIGGVFVQSPLTPPKP